MPSTWPNSANIRKNMAMAQLYELELEQKAGRLVLAALVEDRLAEIFVGLSRSIDTYPARLRSECGLEPEGVLRVQHWLDDERAALARKLDDFFTDESPDG